MPEKRGQVPEEFEAGTATADGPSKDDGEDKVEDEIDGAEETHEKAHRRKRGKSGH